MWHTACPRQWPDSNKKRPFPGRSGATSLTSGMAQKVWSWVLAVALVAGTAQEAFCQTAAPGAPVSEQAPVSAPDVVLLKNGDLFRGTIAEKLQTHTTIVLLTGETRRIPAADIRYAGPADQLPKPAPATSAVEEEVEEEEEDDVEEVEAAVSPLPEGHPIYFTSNVRGATLLARPQGESSAFNLCEAPCKERLPEGAYTLTVKNEEEGMVTRRQFMLNYPTNVEYNYRSRAGLRQAGAVVSVLCLLVGGTVAAFDLSDGDDDHVVTTAALGATVPGLIAGVVLLSIDDAADIRVTPIGGGED